MNQSGTSAEFETFTLPSLKQGSLAATRDLLRHCAVSVLLTGISSKCTMGIRQPLNLGGWVGRNVVSLVSCT